MGSRLFLFLLFFVSVAANVKINLVFVFIGNDSFSGYQALMPMIEVGLASLVESDPVTFANLTATVIWKPNEIFCDADGAAATITAGDVLDIVQQMQGSSVIISPGTKDF